MPLRIILALLTCAMIAQAQTAFINHFSGPVEVSDGDGDWQPARIGMPLAAGNVIRTGDDGRCEIALAGERRIKILANSDLSILSIDNEDLKLRSQGGELYISSESKVEIATEVSTIEGRAMSVYLLNGQSANGIWLEAGNAKVSSAAGGSAKTLTSGDKVTVLQGQAPGQITPLAAVENKLLQEIARFRPVARVEAPSSDGGNLRGQGETAPGTELIGPGVAAPATATSKSSASGSGFGMHNGFHIGASTVNGKIHTMLGLRPEFTFGKIGIGLDLTVFIDENGNIIDDNWQSTEDIIHKFLYIRYGYRGDPFYARVGTITNYSLGFGMLVNRYSNAVLYPDRIKTGMYAGLQGDRLGVELMLNDWAESFRVGGVYGARVTYDLFAGLKIGGNLVYDRNQYKALLDSDQDNVPDIIDDFPDEATYAVDTDGDGVPDAIDPDRDGDGYTDNDPDLNNDADFDSTALKKPFNINEVDDREQIAISVDASLPILNNKLLSTTLYSEYTQFLTDKAGFGFTLPGFVGQVFSFIDYHVAYRFHGRYFLPEYFNTTYELDRVIAVQDTSGQTILLSKRDGLQAIEDQYQGYVAGAGFDIFNLIRLSAEYQQMSRITNDNRNAISQYKTLRANLDINTSFIPKISQAGAYYYDLNVRDLFSRNPGTIYGIKVGYEIAPGASLLVDVRETYKDLNGDGKISGDSEVLRTTYVSTIISF
jgi:hypothetical protein